MNMIPSVPTSQFTGKPKGKMLDGRKARRKKFHVEVLPPRMARGRMPRKAFGKHMGYAERAPLMGDRVFDDGPITNPHDDDYLKR